MKKLFMILPLVFLLCLTFGCQDKEVIAELEEMKAQAEVEELNKEIVKRYWEGKWNDRRPEILDELQTPDVKYHSFSMQMNDLEEYKQVYNMYLSAFHETQITIDGLIAEGDKVMSRVTMNGVHNGDLGGIPPTGKSITGTVFTVFRLIDGKIAEEWEVMDELGLMHQLGMELKQRGNIQISRAMTGLGHDITVLVTASGEERITGVKTVFDSKTIGNDSLAKPNIWYKREFAQAGGITPGRRHTVLVEATSTVGTENATLIWVDQ